MKIKLLLIILTTVLLISCENKKTYKYIETVKEEGVLGDFEIKEKEPKVIKAVSDSLAYLEAYEDFCISLKVRDEMKKSLGREFSVPQSFKLLNENDIDITSSVQIGNKEELEKEIMKRIFALSNSNSSTDKPETLEIVKVDSTRIIELKKYFKIKKDEFSNDNKTWYTPKSAPNYTNRNGLYCYFETENGKPSNFRFRFQYYSDDWLFFSKIQFAIDGKAYEYIPLNTETDSGDGGHIWEWSDEQVSDTDKSLIKALSTAKVAKIKIIGKQYFDTKVVTKQQIIDIKRTLDLYSAMGGQF